jgi:IPT/TIG domain-containing protein
VLLRWTTRLLRRGVIHPRIIPIVMALLIAPVDRAAQAQQVCYAYDRLGQLKGVIDENGAAAFYDLDAVGNILAIRRQNSTGPVTVYAFDPPGATAGTKIEIFGIGFSATASENLVTIGGVAATVVSAQPCSLVIEVPANAVSGQISVTSPAGQGTSATEFTLSTIAVDRPTAAVLLNGTVQFTVVSSGCADPAFLWSVSGIDGGNAMVGTIDANGRYTAPASLPIPATVTIRADSVGCPNLFAETTLTIVAQLNGFVFAGASAQHGSPAPLFPPNVVIESASVRYGSPAPLFPPGTILHSASIANVPVITELTPNTAARSSTFGITIAGINLSGATDLAFLGTATPDAAITVTNVNVDASGTVITANVSISATATIGARTVLVKSPVGNSTSGRTGADVFQVTP